MIAKKGISRKNAQVQEVLSKLDVDMVGVARVKDIKGTKLQESALKLLPSAHSIVVLGMEVYSEFLDLTSPQRVAGAANLNDMYNRHVDHLRGRLTGAVYQVARAAHKSGLKALPLTAHGPAVDGRFLEAVISYKHAAEAAGLGQIGMSSLLVTQEFGPRVNFAVCLTEASLESTACDTAGICRHCNVCVVKCPAHALDWPKNGEPYIINKFACRTYIDASGGCSECMHQCPVASPRYERVVSN